MVKLASGTSPLQNLGNQLGLMAEQRHMPTGESGLQGDYMPAETHMEQPPLTRDSMVELVRDRLSDILEIEPEQIREGDSFADDLEADSLALLELVEALEEELADRTVGFRIEDEDLQDLKTVRDAVDYVFGKVGA